ncbi:guanine nucleotide binding protein 1 [Heterostelium album PN500]|uniref:Guanine nucleotide-binding protein-like 1 n=1 Tax=Heterostelium pallidum (strain ATCC 26659 / Pp 5 / PN500) TaxID=670386 RepID=D3AYJ1_HETP5|nr:guanine nucleotide binding protein 1 [Heterostelium album PN500]EFA86018.1 guanine nucleotide binding protein 1 [Heterostelium album PN500]|eukprot:XP_020438124.1 guanine nucleotide binding protein 1 [Heterostelium album PN500]
MTRAKPFSGKQKKDQLKAKKERKRIENSLEENDDQLSLHEKRKMAREILDSHSYKSNKNSGSSGSSSAIFQSTATKSNNNRTHHHHHINRHSNNRNDRSNNKRSSSNIGSDNEQDDDDDDEEDEIHSQSSESEFDSNSNSDVQSQADTTTEDETTTKNRFMERGGRGRPNLITIFEKESREEIEARKEAAKLPVDLKFRDTPWSVLDEHLGDDSEYIDIPKRPSWSFEYSAERVKNREREMFNQWLDGIVSRYDRSRLNYFEQNLEVWRQLWRVSERSDLILLITDARYPLFHFPPALYHYITQDLKKPMVLVLNKIDLVDSRIIEAWKQYFFKKYPHLKIICFSSFKAIRDDHPHSDPTDVNKLRKFNKGRKRYENAEGKQQLVDLITSFNIEKNGNSSSNNHDSYEEEDVESEEEEEEEEEEEYNQNDDNNVDSKYKPETPNDSFITVGMVGHPNVGKSSLINGLMGRKVVSTSRTPGHTKHFQTIFLTSEIRLCDCPGLVFPALDRPKSLQILCGLFPIAQVREPFSAIRYLAERVAVEKVYGLTNPDDDHRNDTTSTSTYNKEAKEKPTPQPWTPLTICEAFALKRGYLIAKSGRADIHRAGLEILRDCVDGNVVISWPPPGLSKDQYMEIMNTTTINQKSLVSKSNKDIDADDDNDDDESVTTTTTTNDNNRGRRSRKLKIKKKFDNMTMISDDDDEEDEAVHIHRASGSRKKKSSRNNRQQQHSDKSEEDEDDDNDELNPNEVIPSTIAKHGKNKKLSDKAFDYQERLREKQKKGGNKRQVI